MLTEIIVILILIVLFFIIKIKYKTKLKSKSKSKLKIKNKSKGKNKSKLKSKNKLKNNMILKKQTDLIYFDITIGNKFIGKLVIKLYDDIVPKTCHNFRTLCIDKAYENTIFHRIIKDFMIQGGDYENFNGTGGKSIYGDKFADENFDIKHDQPYLLSMANCGEDTNGSQFFITTNPAPHLDGKHVVFGKVIEGTEIIDNLNLVKTNSNDKPFDDVYIKKCGEHYI